MPGDRSIGHSDESGWVLRPTMIEVRCGDDGGGRYISAAIERVEVTSLVTGAVRKTA